MIPRNGLPIKNLPKKKSRPSLLGRPFLWFILIAVVYVGFGLLARIPGLQTKVSGYENIIVTDTDKITTSLDEYLHTRFLYPKSNRLWFSEKKAEHYIEKQFPRITHVKVSSSSGSFSVYGEEREGVYLWCGNEPAPVSVDSLCYFADKTGFIFDIAPYFSGTTYLRLYGGEVSPEIVGSQAFPDYIFTSYENFENLMSDFEMPIQAVYLRDDEQLEFILVSNNEIPLAPRLKHYIPNNEEVVLQNIQAALRQDPVFLDITNNYGTLEYLDARFKNQMVYKFRVAQVNEQIQNEEIIEQTNSDIQDETEDNTSTEG